MLEWLNRFGSVRFGSIGFRLWKPKPNRTGIFSNYSNWFNQFFFGSVFSVNFFSVFSVYSVFRFFCTPLVKSLGPLHFLTFLSFLPPIISQVCPYFLSWHCYQSSFQFPTPRMCTYSLFVITEGWPTKLTPEEMLSIVEPRQQCVREPPICWCSRTSSCGHQLHIKPFSLVSSVNSGGNIEESPLIIMSDLIIHRNGWPLLSIPIPNSMSCCFVASAKLPKFT